MFSVAAATFGVRRCSAAFSFLVAVRLLVRIFSTDCKRDAAARGKLRGDDCLAWCARFHEIVQNAVRDRFVKRALVSIRRQIKLELLALNTKTVGYIIDIDPGEIGLACDRANGREIVGLKMDPVISVGCRV